MAKLFSTERTVADEILGAMREIARPGLGFDAVEGNIKDYPLEFEAGEQRGGYLRALVDGVLTARCWCVDVRSREVLKGTGGLLERTYDIAVMGYYEKGVGGTGYRLLIDHARAVRRAMYDLSPTLGGRVDLMEDGGELEIAEQLDPGNVARGGLLVGRMQWSAIRRNPDF